MTFGLKQIVTDSEGSPTHGNAGGYQLPNKNQMYSSKKDEGTENREGKGIYQDIFNVNNPKPFSYKPE